MPPYLPLKIEQLVSTGVGHSEVGFPFPMAIAETAKQPCETGGVPRRQ